MSLKPILFNTEMVQAILGGWKTETRRVIKPKHDGMLELHEDISGEVSLCEKCGSLCRWLMPPYKPGDILWVRETWQHGYIETSDAPGNNEQWFEESTKNDGDYIKALSGYFYRADFTDGEAGIADIRWRPSIHMPREAARLFLRAKSVRAERLQSIDAADIRAEGLTSAAAHCGDMEIAEKEFAILWDSTIKPADLERYGWEANPWVWVIYFDRCEKPEGWPTYD